MQVGGHPGQPQAQPDRGEGIITDSIIYLFTYIRYCQVNACRSIKISPFFHNARYTFPIV